MPKLTTEISTKPAPRGKWFAPPSGGYSGLSASGHVVPIPDSPPTHLPATAAGVAKLRERKD